MGRLVGLSLAVAILVLAAAVAFATFELRQSSIGEYQLVPAGIDHMYRIDSATGDAWISVDGGDWEAIDEATDSTPEDKTSAPARSAARPRPAHRVGLRAEPAHGAPPIDRRGG